MKLKPERHLEADVSLILLLEAEVLLVLQIIAENWLIWIDINNNDNGKWIKLIENCNYQYFLTLAIIMFQIASISMLLF